MINREDFKLMAVGKYCLGKPSVKAEEFLLFLDGAMFAFDYIEKQNRKDDWHNWEPIKFETKAKECSQ